MDNQHDKHMFFLQNLKRSVREAALSSQSCNSESSQETHSDCSSEHFLVPLGTGFSHLGQDRKHDSLKSRQLFTSQADSSLLQIHARDDHVASKYNGAADTLTDLDSLDQYDRVNGLLSTVGSNSSVSDVYRSFIHMDEAQDQSFSPPLLMDAATLADSYEDLLAPLLDTEAALMEH